MDAESVSVIAVSLGGEVEINCKETRGTFWGDGNVPKVDCGEGYATL